MVHREEALGKDSSKNNCYFYDATKKAYVRATCSISVQDCFMKYNVILFYFLEYEKYGKKKQHKLTSVNPSI